ncbi:MAG: glycosyltransferase family 2 protein [bacterium]
MRPLLVLPCYNEEKTIDQVLKGVFHWAPSLDVLVVDDGSLDQTPRLLTSYKGLKIIRHHVNLGYGRALIDGFKYAQENGYEVCLTMDCDAQHEPRLIPEFLKEIPGWDVVSGSRYLMKSETVPPQDRFELNMEITRIINELTGYKLTDSFCGFKAYRVSSLGKLSLSEPGYGLPLQFWIQAAKVGLKIKEIPVPLIYMDYSRTFPGELRNASQRRKYYLEIIKKALADK